MTKIIKAGQARSGTVILPGTHTVPEGKVWIVHFVPVGSRIQAQGGPIDDNRVYANLVNPYPQFYNAQVTNQVFGLSHTGDGPVLYGMWLPPGTWENVSIYAYSQHPTLGPIEYWGTYLVMEVDADEFGV